MSWILGLLGAVLGLAMAETDDGFFGLVAGTLVGALLGQAQRLRRRVAELEQRLGRVEARAPDAPTALDATRAPSPEYGAAEVFRVPSAAVAPAFDLRSPVAATPAPPPLPDRPTPMAPSRGPPTPTAQPRQPDAIERAVAVARGWLFEGNVPVKLGLLVLMFGVASLLKYASDAGWLTLPIEYRLSLIAAAAIAGLVWGLRSATERPAFGLSLQGGAIGVLLLTVFAAFRVYQLLDPMPAFAMIVVLVAGASVLAVKQNAPALALLGFIGGYLAPVLISTGSGNHVALFGYYAVLNAAVFAIAWKRPWRALNLVGFLFTFAIGGAWGAKYYRPELISTVEPFLVLFFLFYVAIPVLYALAGRQKNGKVDGTLLFGTPLLAFPMQAGLVEGDRLLLALSAVAVAGVYAGLAVWATRNQRLRTLAQSSAAMGVVFATLAVPLALSARWTSAAWSLQGLGMVWLGLRQQRRLTRWAGLALLLLSGVAWIVSLWDWSLGAEDRFVLNGHAMNLALLAVATLAASWLYERAGAGRLLAISLFAAGLGWWTTLGLREIAVNLEPASDETAVAVFAALSAAIAALLRAPLKWPRLAWPITAATAVCLLLAVSALDGDGAHWFKAPLLPWWGICAVLLVSLRALLHPRSATLPIAHIALLTTLALGVGISLHAVLRNEAGLGDGWVLPGSLLPLAGLGLGAWRRPRWTAWPVADAFPQWRPAWLGMAAFGLLAAWLAGQFMPGNSTPLLWLPLFNPLELSLVAVLVVGIWLLREQPDTGRGQAGWALWAFAALLTLTLAVLRACHQLGDDPWSPMILSSRVAQASLTVAWCVAGVTAWIFGSRRHNRPLWWVGAALLGVVLLKLVIVDRQFVGNIAGIVSFLAVGGLLIIVGRIAPTPPRMESR